MTAVHVLVVALVAGACGGRAAETSPPSSAAVKASSAVETNDRFEDWYPSDITPPAGTQYPCALIALPHELTGVPSTDRRFINHVYSLLLKATQAKLVLLKALESTEGLSGALERYLDDVKDARARLVEEPVPAGLEPFAADVLAALDLQKAFFVSAVERRGTGTSVHDVYALPEGRQASQHLLSAWGRMQQRYPAWNADLKDSMYHHLCALDLF